MLTLIFKLACTFFHIGIFGFGGGYAMISLIQFEVVNSNGWMDTEQFANLLALSQMTPGPISINAATYVGYNVLASYGYGWAIVGSIVSTFALILPSIILMWAVIRFLFKNEGNRYINYLFSGLKPAVVGLIFSAGLLMMVDCDTINQYVMGVASELNISWKEENFGSDIQTNIFSIIVCAVTFVSVYFLDINPIKIIIVARLVGFGIYGDSPLSIPALIIAALLFGNSIYTQILKKAACCSTH